MIITESTLYWLTRLDKIIGICNGIEGLAFVISVLMAVILGVNSINKLIDFDYSAKRAFEEIRWSIKYFAILFSIMSICCLGKAFIPTTKEICAIKVIPAIVNNENMQQIGSDFVDLTKEWMNELKPNKVLDSNKKK